MKNGAINDSNDSIRVIAVEGCAGVGKTTLVRAYSKRHPEIKSVECVPAVYLVDVCLMMNAKFRASPTGRMLVNVGRMATEFRKVAMPLTQRTLSDQSIWSVVAGRYARNPRCLNRLLAAVDALRADLVLPDCVVVLKGSYETCLSRLAGKGCETGNADMRRIFGREYKMYDALKRRGYEVRFISTDGKTPDEVLSEFEALTTWWRNGRANG